MPLHFLYFIHIKICSKFVVLILVGFFSLYFFTFVNEISEHECMWITGFDKWRALLRSKLFVCFPFLYIKKKIQLKYNKNFSNFNDFFHLNFVFLFLCSFVSVFCAFWTGLSGCWRRSAGAITATAILMLLTCLLAAGAMGLWHTVEFFEKEKVVGDEFYQQWANVLRDNTRISYDWSYVLAWAGVASSLIAAILLSGAAVCLRSEREKEEQLNLQYLMPGTGMMN